MHARGLSVWAGELIGDGPRAQLGVLFEAAYELVPMPVGSGIAAESREFLKGYGAQTGIAHQLFCGGEPLRCGETIKECAGICGGTHGSRGGREFFGMTACTARREQARGCDAQRRGGRKSALVELGR